MFVCVCVESCSLHWLCVGVVVTSQCSVVYQRLIAIDVVVARYILCVGYWVRRFFQTVRNFVIAGTVSLTFFFE